MLSKKGLLTKIRFDANPYYEEVHNIIPVDINIKITPNVEYSIDTNKHSLVLNILAQFTDTEDGVEIVGYEGFIKAELNLTNRKDDKKELIVWLKHILAVLKAYWLNVCPIPYMSKQLVLNEHEESDAILDFLEAKQLYR